MGTATVLVVDNNPEVLSIVGKMLTRSRFGVLTADSASEALNVIRAHPKVNLVLSEAVLPDGSGPELIQSVQESFPSTAVMLMAAYTDGKLDPAIPCLQKPFSLHTLTQRVHEVLAECQKAREQLGRTLARGRSEIERSRQLCSNDAKLPWQD